MFEHSVVLAIFKLDAKSFFATLEKKATETTHLFCFSFLFIQSFAHALVHTWLFPYFKEKDANALET